MFLRADARNVDDDDYGVCDCWKMGEMHGHLDEIAFKGATADRFIKIVVVSGCWFGTFIFTLPRCYFEPAKG